WSRCRPSRQWSRLERASARGGVRRRGMLRRRRPLLRPKTSSCWSPSLHSRKLVYQRVAKPFFDFVKAVFGWMYLVLPIESRTKRSSQIDVDHSVRIGTLQRTYHPVHIVDQYPEN